MKKRTTQHDRMNKIPKAFFGTGHCRTDLVDTRAITTIELPTDGVGQELLGQATGKGFVLRDNQLPKLVHG